MAEIRRAARKTFSWSHQWVGLIAGLLFAALAFTGGVAAFRPQIAGLLSRAAPGVASCAPSVDWDRAQREVESFAHSRINRIYAPTAPDQRYHFRMATDRDAIFSHVIFDACSAKVLGNANLAWLDWLVDFHHNLRAGRAGRYWAGWIAVVLLISAVTGVAIRFLSRARLLALFRIRAGSAMARDLHASAGMYAAVLLALAAFSGLWLCFPKSMRAMLGALVPVPAETRAPRPPKPAAGTPAIGLGEIIAAARRAIPDGVIREIRMPEDYGNVQVRMWRPGDFRSLGNNVVTVDNVTARVVAVDFYRDKPPSGRFMQAMIGLHYGEWGGLAYRSLYGFAGLVSALLFATGFLLWWLPKWRAATSVAKLSTRPVPAGTLPRMP